MTSDYYRAAGIDDVAKFYRDRFFTGGVRDARYFDAIFRFDINQARTMWIYDNVHRSSSLLDLGCGEGILALLKRKDVHLTGVDLSPDLLKSARDNGYDRTLIADLTDLPFSSDSFDYVVSLDVMGHIAKDQKDAVLKEIKRVLRPDGVTMHGIEVLDRELHQDYDSMSPEKFARFIGIDGHIGLEDEDQIAARFQSFFAYVQTEPRYTLCLSCDEFIKQYDQYGAPFEADFVEYLRGLSFSERHAFDMAMGYVFGKISDLHIQLPKSGLYLLLKGSDSPPGPFYNAHRDRRDLFFSNTAAEDPGPICLDRSSRAVFDNGWYGANNLPPVARWMGGCGRIRFTANSLSMVRYNFTTHIPELRSKPMRLEVLVNGDLLSHFCLFDYGWQQITIDIPQPPGKETTEFELEIRADRTWQPCVANANSGDDRNLSIAVCNIEIA
jgi:ubiquinone/menaquinone biosynthesis C-methylase UbiE